MFDEDICIGCEKKPPITSKDVFCETCYDNMLALEKQLKKLGMELELEHVEINR